MGHPRTSQLAPETCERATELSSRSPLTIVKIRYLDHTQSLTIRHPSLASLKLAVCVLPAVKITFVSCPLIADLALCYLLRNRDDLIQNKVLYITILNFG